MKYILTAISILLLTLPAYGKGNGKNKHHNNDYQQHNQYEQEYDYEHQYESDNKHQKKNKHKKKHKNKQTKKNKKHNQDGDLPPGLQKKVDRGGDLPPGWQKKMRKGYRVDDDIYHHMRDVDRDTLRLLPPLRYGESYKCIENDIVKLKKSSREILKVIKKKGIEVIRFPKSERAKLIAKAEDVWEDWAKRSGNYDDAKKAFADYIRIRNDTVAKYQ